MCLAQQFLLLFQIKEFDPIRPKKLVSVLEWHENWSNGETRDKLFKAHYEVLPIQIETIDRDGNLAGEIFAQDARFIYWSLHFLVILETSLQPYPQKP